MDTLGHKTGFRTSVAKRFGFIGTLDAAFGMVTGVFAPASMTTDERLQQRAANDAAQR